MKIPNLEYNSKYLSQEMAAKSGFRVVEQRLSYETLEKLTFVSKTTLFDTSNIDQKYLTETNPSSQFNLKAYERIRRRFTANPVNKTFLDASSESATD